jgi:multidrug efflux pump subunit AcrA (membrane-fusion protein)
MKLRATLIVWLLVPAAAALAVVATRFYTNGSVTLPYIGTIVRGSGQGPTVQVMPGPSTVVGGGATTQPVLFSQADAADDTASDVETESRVVIGLVVPTAQVDVRAQVDGMVAECAKKVGDKVEAGQLLAMLDEKDLLIEGERQAARLEAAKHRIKAAEEDLKYYSEKSKKLASVGSGGASAAPFEVTQAKHEEDAAAARLKSLEQERIEQQVETRAIERKREKCKLLSPIGGRVIEVVRTEGEYVRQGELVARVESAERRVYLNLPLSLAERASHLSFRLEEKKGQWVSLSVAEMKNASNLDGTRSLSLAVPVGSELLAGQAVKLEVGWKP